MSDRIKKEKIETQETKKNNKKGEKKAAKTNQKSYKQKG